MLSRLFILASFFLFWGTTTPISWGAANWATGTDLQKRLAESIDITWAENPLRPALESLARQENVAVLIDRRIDPGRKTAISLRQTPLRDAFEKIAQHCDMGISMVGPVAYFAPAETAKKVRTLIVLRREDVGRASLKASKNFQRRKPVVWDDFAQPRELLEKLATEYGFKIAGLEQIPHDLWAAADLPPLDAVEAITLIAGQYDLTFAISSDGDRIDLVPVPRQLAIARSYPAGQDPRTTVEKYTALAPTAQIKIDGGKIAVAGLIEDHERITSPPAPPARGGNRSAADGKSAPDFASKRYTLTVTEQPIGALLEQLGPKLNLEIKIDDQAIRQAGVSLDRRVSFSVKNATIDELLQAALQGSGLKFTRRGNIVQIQPALVK